MAASDSKVLLGSAARGALGFQRWGVFGLTPSNIPVHRRWTSHKHCCMRHRRVSSTSRTKGSTLDFAAFCRAAAGLVFNECSGLEWVERQRECWCGRCHQPGRCEWWRMCSAKARSQCCCQLGRPPDPRWPTQARSVRTSSSEEGCMLTKRCTERK